MIYLSRYDLRGLGQRGRRALLEGINVVIETALTTAADALQGQSPEASSPIWRWLPPEFGNRYTSAFFSAFAASTVIVGWKLTDPDNIYPLASVAEEMALHAMFTEARLEFKPGTGPRQRLADVFSDLVEDEDFLFLFDSKTVDIQDQPAIQECVPTANLRFTEWLKPFNPNRHVAPFVFPDDKRWAACWTSREDWWDSGEGNDDDGDAVRPALAKPESYRKCRDCELFVVPDARGVEPTGFLHLTSGRTDHPAWPSDDECQTLASWLATSSLPLS